MVDDEDEEDSADAVERWREDGFCILPALGRGIAAVPVEAVEAEAAEASALAAASFRDAAASVAAETISFT